MLGAGTVRKLYMRRVGRYARMSASNGGDKVAEREKGDAAGRGARIKQSRRSRCSESGSPAVLLVDDHVHLPASVFCDPPMRHQQTDTCGEGGGMQNTIRTGARKTHTHTPARLSGRFTNTLTGRGVTAPERRDGSKSRRP